MDSPGFPVSRNLSHDLRSEWRRTIEECDALPVHPERFLCSIAIGIATSELAVAKAMVTGSATAFGTPAERRSHQRRSGQKNKNHESDEGNEDDVHGCEGRRMQEIPSL
jgi:hypothetical protein